MGDFVKLDPLLHSELRLAVMSTLLSLEEADFVYLRDRQTVRGRVHHCRKRVRRAETADCVQDNSEGAGGVCGVCGGTKVVSALSADTTSLRFSYPSPNPFQGRGFGRRAPALSADTTSLRFSNPSPNPFQGRGFGRRAPVLSADTTSLRFSNVSRRVHLFRNKLSDCTV